MRKIPTLFLRDPETNLRYLTHEVHPDCYWVIDGEGIATRKWDGTCVMSDGDSWWVRREVKPGKVAPTGYVPLETDEATGKTVGWEPVEQSGFMKYLREAVGDDVREPGTYELIGPKINGNPERRESHVLVKHGEYLLDVPRSRDLLEHWLRNHPQYEGIVWHHPDGHMAKIKRKDFPEEITDGTT